MSRNYTMISRLVKLILSLEWLALLSLSLSQKPMSRNYGMIKEQVNLILSLEWLSLISLLLSQKPMSRNYGMIEEQVNLILSLEWLILSLNQKERFTLSLENHCQLKDIMEKQSLEAG